MLDRLGAQPDPSASKKGTKTMTKNIKLVVGASALALLGLSALQGCSSDASDSTPTAGSSAAGAHTGGAGAGGASAGAATGGGGAGGAAAGAGGSTAGAGGSTAGAGGSTAGAGGSTAGAGGGGTAGAPSAACTTFCADEKTTCTFDGANAAYASEALCFAGCATFTPGTGNSGNTLSCRQYHVMNAKTMGAAAHCPHTALKSHNMGSAVTATDGPCN